MKLHLLKTFYFVALEKSFTGAAKKLFITQPAISSHIQSLENDLGVKLFQRDKKSRDVSLTPEGEKLLGYVETLFSLMEEMTSAFSEIKENKQNSLSIGTTTVYGVYFFPDILRLFTQKYPSVRINNCIGNSHQILEMLKNGEIEIAIIRGSEGVPDDYSKLLVHTENLIFIASPSHTLATGDTITIDKIKDYSFIHREKGSHTRNQIEKYFEKHDISGLSLLELGNIESVKKSVADGIGISIAPRIAVETELNDKRLMEIKIEGLSLEAEYFLIYPEKDSLSGASLNFISIVEESHNL